MKALWAALFCFLSCCGIAQLFDSLVTKSDSYLERLGTGDSLIYYQCHVEAAGIQVATASGQTLTSGVHKCSITEKFVITKTSLAYEVKYYSSSYTDLPNRRFSGLKIREKPYWNFKENKKFLLSETGMKVLLAMERKGKEAIEFDYVISKNNPNQLIIRNGRDFKQLVIDGNYVLSRLLIQ
jgi:hypothetical protein